MKTAINALGVVHAGIFIGGDLDGKRVRENLLDREVFYSIPPIYPETRCIETAFPPKNAAQKIMYVQLVTAFGYGAGRRPSMYKHFMLDGMNIEDAEKIAHQWVERRNS